MSIEVEMKFIANEAGQEAVIAAIAPWVTHQYKDQSLANCYFETAEHDLRHHDMGLRIRRNDDQYEMTLKTAGKVIGGLHQRPEYNVKLSSSDLDITLFPKDVWPKDCDVNALQNRLSPLFNTDFIRQSWLVNFEGSDIEVALDKGDIVAGDHKQAITEIELELKTGDPKAVFALAKALSHCDGIRLGGQSKAARGYALVTENQGHHNDEITDMKIIRYTAKSTVEQGLEQALSHIISHWQNSEEAWLAGDKTAKKSLLHSMGALRQLWVIFGGVIPRKATTTLRDALLSLEQSLECDSVLAETLCYQASYLQLKLALLSHLLNKEWRTFVDEKGQKKLSTSFKRFCDVMLGRCGAELKNTFSSKQTNDAYQDQLAKLTRQTYSLLILSGAYHHDEATHYIDAWLVLRDVIEGRREGEYEPARKQALSYDPFWLNGA